MPKTCCWHAGLANFGATQAIGGVSPLQQANENGLLSCRPFSQKGHGMDNPVSAPTG
jgi:hypothetical protein